MFPKLGSKQDRRHRKRQLLNTSVRVITKAGAMDALGINISEGGMGLFTVAHLPLGARIEVEFRTPDGPASFMRIPATVRHRALYLYGIEFHTNEADNSMNTDQAASIRSQA
jgi:PilZ domain